eukprot:359131-Chlamydomonas_euryale.AAC.2
MAPRKLWVVPCRQGAQRGTIACCRGHDQTWSGRTVHVSKRANSPLPRQARTTVAASRQVPDHPAPFARTLRRPPPSGPPQNRRRGTARPCPAASPVFREQSRFLRPARRMVLPPRATAGSQGLGDGDVCTRATSCPHERLPRRAQPVATCVARPFDIAARRSRWRRGQHRAAVRVTYTRAARRSTLQGSGAITVGASPGGTAVAHVLARTHLRRAYGAAVCSSRAVNSVSRDADSRVTDAGLPSLLARAELTRDGVARHGHFSTPAASGQHRWEAKLRERPAAEALPGLPRAECLHLCAAMTSCIEAKLPPRASESPEVRNRARIWRVGRRACANGPVRFALAYYQFANGAFCGKGTCLRASSRFAASTEDGAAAAPPHRTGGGAARPMFPPPL